MPASAFRDDITVIGMPLTEICNAVYTDPRQRTAVQEHHGYGARWRCLLDIDTGRSSKALFAEQYKGKEKLLESNVRALHAGA